MGESKAIWKCRKCGKEYKVRDIRFNPDETYTIKEIIGMKNGMETLCSINIPCECGFFKRLYGIIEE